MTMQTESRFDAAEFKRAYEEADLGAVQALYAENVVITQITPDNPPSNPFIVRGRDSLVEILEAGLAQGARAKVDRLVVHDDVAAATFTCTFPNGMAVIANGIMDLSDGLVVRYHEVVVGG
jgi:hypothetical protein